jgi:hypothetical protein
MPKPIFTATKLSQLLQRLKVDYTSPKNPFHAPLRHLRSKDLTRSLTLTPQASKGDCQVKFIYLLFYLQLENTLIYPGINTGNFILSSFLSNFIQIFL